jgi:hypothetical protein
MGGEAGVIAVTRAADFFLDGRHLKVQRIFKILSWMWF